MWFDSTSKSQYLIELKVITKMTNKKNPQSTVERLISSLEKRIKGYERNLEQIEKDYHYKAHRELRKLDDASLQLKALKKK